MSLAMPSGLAAGDICVAHIAMTGPRGLQVPAGWTRIREDVNGYQCTQGLYWHLTGSADPGIYAWSTADGSVSYFEAAIGCYAGVNKATPIDPGAPNGSGAVSVGTSGVTAPSITTQTGADLIIGVAMDSETSWGQGAVVNLAASSTVRWAAYDANADYLATVGGDRTLSGAGATGSLNVTTTNGQPSDGLIAQQVALQPGP